MGLYTMPDLAHRVIKKKSYYPLQVKKLAKYAWEDSNPQPSVPKAEHMFCKYLLLNH